MTRVKLVIIMMKPGATASTVMSSTIDIAVLSPLPPASGDRPTVNGPRLTDCTGLAGVTLGSLSDVDASSAVVVAVGEAAARSGSLGLSAAASAA